MSTKCVDQVCNHGLVTDMFSIHHKNTNLFTEGILMVCFLSVKVKYWAKSSLNMDPECFS